MQIITSQETPYTFPVLIGISIVLEAWQGILCTY